jgi:hypothetical protein
MAIPTSHGHPLLSSSGDVTTETQCVMVLMCLTSWLDAARMNTSPGTPISSSCTKTHVPASHLLRTGLSRASSTSTSGAQGSLGVLRRRYRKDGRHRLPGCPRQWGDCKGAIGHPCDPAVPRNDINGPRSCAWNAQPSHFPTLTATASAVKACTTALDTCITISASLQRQCAACQPSAGAAEKQSTLQ